MQNDDIAPLHVRMYGLLRAVCAGEHTPEDAAEFLTEEVERSYWRGYTAAGAPGYEEALPNGSAPTTVVF